MKQQRIAISVSAAALVVLRLGLTVKKYNRV